MEVRDHPTGLSGAYGASPLISGRLRGSRVEISKEKSNAFFLEFQRNSKVKSTNADFRNFGVKIKKDRN